MSTTAGSDLPNDVEALKAILLAERETHRIAMRDQGLRIEKLKQTIARLQHDRYGQSSERRALLSQLELQLFELEGPAPTCWPTSCSASTGRICR